MQITLYKLTFASSTKKPTYEDVLKSGMIFDSLEDAKEFAEEDVLNGAGELIDRPEHLGWEESYNTERDNEYKLHVAQYESWVFHITEIVI